MAREEQTEIRMRIVIERPVPGVLHSLQEDDAPLDPKGSAVGEPLTFDFPLRIAPGPKFFGKQVRREGPVRRFVYIRVGTAAGQMSSPWTRRMKIDIHDIAQSLLDAAANGGVLEGTIDGMLKDGSPACATVRTTGWRGCLAQWEANRCAQRSWPGARPSERACWRNGGRCPPRPAARLPKR